MTFLPETWVQTLLGQVVAYGKTDKVEPNELDVSAWILELEDIEKNTSKLLARLSFQERQSKSTKNRFETGDVLYGKLRPYLNKVIIADSPGYCTTEIIPLKAGDHLDNRYLFYWLKHPVFLDYVEAESHGLNMPRLGSETGRAAPFVLAPCNEQKRIADKLDAVLARVDACRDRLDRIPAILKRFRQSVLVAASTGKLTEGWREINGNETADWKIAKGSEVFAFITSGSRGWASHYSTSGAIFLRIGNLDHETIALDLSDIQYVNPPKGAEGIRTRIKLNDILISITADVGMIGLVSEPLGEAYINQHICLARPKPEHEPKYLAYFLASPKGGLGCLQVLSRGATKVGLTLGDIRDIEIKLPSEEEQKEIVRRVESLFTYADRLEARYKTARAQVEKLTPALLAKAFRGELVPQDPNDEPASQLLARIAATKPKNEPTKRSGRKAKASISVAVSKTNKSKSGG